MWSVRESDRNWRSTGPIAIVLRRPRAEADLHAVDFGVALQVGFRRLRLAGHRRGHILDVRAELAVHFDLDDIDARRYGLPLVVHPAPRQLVAAAVARRLADRLEEHRVLGPERPPGAQLLDVLGIVAPYRDRPHRPAGG